MKPANKKFNRTSNDYEITFGSETVVRSPVSSTRI
jgi:hypothetical protein